MNPCVNGFVKAVLKGCKRLDIARVPKQKSPMSNLKFDVPYMLFHAI